MDLGIANRLRKTGWIPPKEDNEIVPKVYGAVIVRDLTSEKLRDFSMREASLYSVTVEFRSPSGMKYQAIHFVKHPEEGSHVLLYSPSNLSDSDWNDVVQTIDRIVNVPHLKFDGIETKSNVNRVIRLLETPTRAKIADYIDAYQKHFGKFGEVSVKGAIFTNASRNSCEYLSSRENIQIIGLS